MIFFKKKKFNLKFQYIVILFILYYSNQNLLYSEFKDNHTELSNNKKNNINIDIEKQNSLYSNNKSMENQKYSDYMQKVILSDSVSGIIFNRKTDIVDISISLENMGKSIFQKKFLEKYNLDPSLSISQYLMSLIDSKMNKFEQIVMEFHFPFSDIEAEVFDKINKNHYLVHFHGNNCCGVRDHNGVVIPNIFD